MFLFEFGKGFGGFVRDNNAAVRDFPDRPFDQDNGDDDDEEGEKEEEEEDEDYISSGRKHYKT